MNIKRWLYVLMILSLALTSACGGGKTSTSAEESPATTGTEFEFPLPDDVDASAVMDLGDGAINLQTTLSLPDAVSFYRSAFVELGYIERELLTSIEDTAFSIVFDGHPNGKAIVVQGVDLDDSVNINLRFEDI